MSWQLLWPLLPHPLWTGKPTKRKRATSLYCINEFFILKVERGSKCLKTVFLYFGTDNWKVYCPKIRKIMLHFGQLLLLRKGTIEKKTFWGFKYTSIHLGNVCDWKRARKLAGMQMIKGNVKPAFKARGPLHWSWSYFHGMRWLGIFPPLPRWDVSQDHCKVTPEFNLLVPIYTPTWSETLPKNAIQWPQL